MCIINVGETLAWFHRGISNYIKSNLYFQLKIINVGLDIMGLIRKQIYSIDTVREKVKDVLFEKDRRLAKVDFDGDLVKGNSYRYQTFFTKGCKCVKCGIEGKFFAKERFPDNKVYHLNLYAIDQDGNEVLMTKDHIIPKSKGGSSNISNYQTMCRICNKNKGNNLEK